MNQPGISKPYIIKDKTFVDSDGKKNKRVKIGLHWLLFRHKSMTVE